MRSDLLEQFRRAQPPYAPPELPNYRVRRRDAVRVAPRAAPLHPAAAAADPEAVLQPQPADPGVEHPVAAEHEHAEREAKREAARHAFDQLHYEVMHNLVMETTRLGIEVKNLKMRVESLASRLEFNERRARALESVVRLQAGGRRPRDPGWAPRRASRRDERREDSRATGGAPWRATAATDATARFSSGTGGVPGA